MAFGCRFWRRAGVICHHVCQRCIWGCGFSQRLCGDRPSTLAGTARHEQCILLPQLLAAYRSFGGLRCCSDQVWRAAPRWLGWISAVVAVALLVDGMAGTLYPRDFGPSFLL